MVRLKEAVRPYYLRWFYFPLRPSRRPAEFRDSWRYPFQKFGPATTLPPPPSGLPYLLFYPMTDWHSRTQRTQHLVSAFAGLGFPCLYLNPHLGREFDTAPLFDRAHRLSQLEDRIFELHVRLPREPVFHDRLLTAEEEHILFSALRQVLPAGAPAIQILSFPLWLGLARRFRNGSSFSILYDCHDLLSGFHNIAPDILAAESELLRDSDLVLFSSQGLQETYEEMCRKWLLVRNAVDARQFVPAARPQAPDSQPPTVVYAGALDSWFDIEAVETAAARNPDARFLLAGRIEYAPIRKLAALPNVELLGELSYERIPALLAGARAALIPFRINPLTLMTNPIKLYEYFSCGLPVVSTPLPEAQSMHDLVYLAATPADFAAHVTRALREDDSSLRGRRREIAARESWTARAQTITAEFPALLRAINLPLQR